MLRRVAHKLSTTKTYINNFNKKTAANILLPQDYKKLRTTRP